MLNRAGRAGLLVTATVLAAVGVSSASAATIDAVIEADCEAAGVELPPMSDDATFLRRVYLDGIGRIPTLAEARAFLDSADPDKRTKLIGQLLSSEGCAKHWFHFWADLLRVSTEVKLSAAVTNPWSPVMRAAQVADKRETVDALFLSILTRRASEREHHIAAGESPPDLAAALLATAEFLFVR